MMSQGILAALSYAFVSVLIMIVNKALLNTWKFNFPYLLVFTHFIVVLSVLTILKFGKLVDYPEFNVKTASKVLPLALVNVANIIISQLGLRLVNIPMFTTLRRLTALFVIITQWKLNRTYPSKNVLFAVAVMMLGALVGGWGDLQFDLFGYTYIICNNLLTAAHLSMIKKVGQEAQLGTSDDSFGIVYYQTVIALPVLAVGALLSGELAAVYTFPHAHNPSFQATYIASALLAVGIQYTTVWSTKVNSPLTTSVTGQAKNVLTTIVSILVFGLLYTPSLAAGLSIGLLGSCLYAYFKFLEQRNARANNNNSNNSSSGGSSSSSAAAAGGASANGNAAGHSSPNHSQQAQQQGTEMTSRPNARSAV